MIFYQHHMEFACKTTVHKCLLQFSISSLYAFASVVRVSNLLMHTSFNSTSYLSMLTILLLLLLLLLQWWRRRRQQQLGNGSDLGCEALSMRYVSIDIAASNIDCPNFLFFFYSPHVSIIFFFPTHSYERARACTCQTLIHSPTAPKPADNRYTLDICSMYSEQSFN